MNCWNSLITIDNTCSDTEPESGLTLQHLPMVNITSANAAATKEKSSGIIILNQKLELAKQDMIARLRTKLEANVQIKSNLENDTIGHYRKNLDPVALEAGRYKGIRIRIDRYPYLKFFVHKIKLQMDTSGAHTIKVFNLMTGLQVGNDIAITAVKDAFTAVEVNRTYQTDKQILDLIFVIDSGVAGTYKTNLHRSHENAHCRNCLGNYKGGYSEFSGVDISQAAVLTEENLSTNDGTNGMSIDYAVDCCLDSYICNLGTNIAMGLLWKWGELVLQELQYSSRLSSLITVQSEDIKQLRSEFIDQYDEFMRHYLKDLVPPDDFCFNCRPRAQVVTSIP